nr:hypothetical protein KXZ65_18625 [Pectobacterium sp. PL152]
MVFRSTFSTVIQACNVPDVNASGKPEAKPSNSIKSELRWLNKAMMRLNMKNPFPCSESVQEQGKRRTEINGRFL